MLRLTAALFWLDGGVCSQDPSHSFWIAGRQLPLCARDLGLFGGFLLAWLALSAGRVHIRWRPAWLLGFIPVGLDGFNSLAWSLGGSLYPASNGLRLATGLLAGICLAILLRGTLGRAREASSGRPLTTLIVAAAIGLPTTLLAPYLAIALAASAGVLLLLAQANRLLGRAPGMAAYALVVPELAALALLRHAAVALLG